MKNIVYIFTVCMGICVSSAFIACDENIKAEFQRDLPQITASGVLNVITTNNSTSYFLYRGQAMGYEYEMAEHLADKLGLELNIIVADNFNEVFDLLESGKGDIIAFGLTVTEARKKQLAFTNDLYLTHQVLVQRKPDNWKKLSHREIQHHLVRNPAELIGDTIYVGEGTSYFPRLKNLEKEIGGKITIKEIKGDKITDEIIRMVVDKKIDYTVADYNLAAVNQALFPILDIHTRISFSQHIAWAVRKNSPQLLKAVNEWIKGAKEQRFYTSLYNKYFKNKRSYLRRVNSDYFSKNTGKISPYDDLIKHYADALGWDWWLLTSLIYQESRFNPDIEGRLGASGLMQLMPEALRVFQVKNPFNPEENIRGGTAFLNRLYSRFERVEDSIQRIKFTMAAYNAGIGHIYDAQRLAQLIGLDPYVWDDNVEEAIILLSKHEYFTRPEIRYGYVRGFITDNYIHEIFRRYKQYEDLILPENSSERVEAP